MMALLVLLIVLTLLGGPLALILSLIALSRLNSLERRLERLQKQREMPQPGPAEAESQQATHPATDLLRNIESARAEEPDGDALTLEQRIGTRWVLVAGVIALIFGVGFFLKYAYDNRWITPVTQVLIAAVMGLAALAVGELTRRWGYGFVARGVTAMGFAILYATVFAANRWHRLIDAPPAYVLACVITAAAMAYAVGLNEIVAAILALVGGYFTPVIFSMRQEVPTGLFSYLLILSIGAMLCAYWRRWTAVNILAFLGTYSLYARWFDWFCGPNMPERPRLLGIAAVWLAVFFLVFLLLPIFHTLLRRTKSQLADVVLLPINAVIALYYLWNLLGDHYRTTLALCSLALGAAHIVMAAVTMMRCREDASLRQVLLVIGLAAATLAVPLYWERYAVPTAFAVEAMALAAIGIRYRSFWVQGAAAVVMGTALAWLVRLWPMHTEPFRVVFNPEFGTWCLVAAAILAGHLLYRFSRQANTILASGTAVSDVLYAVGLLVLMAAVSAELSYHNMLNQAFVVRHDSFVRQMMLVFPSFTLLFVVRPICPRGLLCRVVASALAATGAAYLVVNYLHLHFGPFTILANVDFGTAMVQIAVLFSGRYLIRRFEHMEGYRTAIAAAFGLAGVVVLCIILTEEIWLFFRWGEVGEASEWQAQMWISVMWAVYGTTLMIVGFWRRIRTLRYMALALLCLLLGKVFLWDTRTLHPTYRIAAFLTTGLALVAISYLYQYLKKRGFFDRILTDSDKS
jgi:uncharacterized membrane protein